MSAGLVLASRSPQRRAILEQVGLDFEVVAPDVEEVERGEPAAIAVANAERKARAVAGEVVVAADTVVALGDAVYGKPRDGDEAARSLAALSGREHEVVSGLAVAEGGELRTATATTAVAFRALDAATVAWYVAGGEWRERAGGYAIQGRGAALVERIDGDYLNVVGLPLAALLGLAPDLLTRFARQLHSRQS